MTSPAAGSGPDAGQLRAMQAGDYILLARGDELMRVPVRKTRLPLDPVGRRRVLPDPHRLLLRRRRLRLGRGHRHDAVPPRPLAARGLSGAGLQGRACSTNWIHRGLSPTSQVWIRSRAPLPASMRKTATFPEFCPAEYR